MRAAAVVFRDGQVVLEGRVRLLERVLELVALEDVVACLGLGAVPELRVDNPPDGPESAGLSLDPDEDALLTTGVVDPLEHPLREPSAVGGDPHGSDYTIALMLRLVTLLRNPFSFLFTRSSAEEQVVAYLTREHRRGRALAEILQDRYVKNRLSPQQQARLLDDPELVKVLGEQDIDAARDAMGVR